MAFVKGTLSQPFPSARLMETTTSALNASRVTYFLHLHNATLLKTLTSALFMIHQPRSTFVGSVKMGFMYRVILARKDLLLLRIVPPTISIMINVLLVHRDFISLMTSSNVYQ